MLSEIGNRGKRVHNFKRKQDLEGQVGRDTRDIQLVSKLSLSPHSITKGRLFPITIVSLAQACEYSM